MPQYLDRRCPIFRADDRSRDGVPFVGAIAVDVYDPMLSRVVDGPSGRTVLAVGFDGDGMVFRGAEGREWHLGLGELHDAIGYLPGTTPAGVVVTGREGEEAAEELRQAEPRVFSLRRRVMLLAGAGAGGAVVLVAALDDIVLALLPF